MRFSRQTSTVRVALSATVMMGIALIGTLIPPRIAHAQAAPTFEVSPAPAVATARPPYNPASGYRTPQTLVFEQTLVGDMIAFAYGLPLDRVERRPQWMYDNRYNVTITTPAPAGLPEQKLMLQKLLEERFGLVVHRISYPSPVYFLVAGAKVNLTKAQEDTAVDIPQFRDQRVELAAQGAFPSYVLRGEHVSMNDLADWLYTQMQLPVVDKTGIPGLFDVELGSRPLRGSNAVILAVRNSLGLDLQLGRGTAESLIIDRSQEPSPN